MSKEHKNNSEQVSGDALLHLDKLDPEGIVAALRRGSRDLWPELRGDELDEAAENLYRYFMNALRIYPRLENDPEAMTRFEESIRENGEAKLRRKHGTTSV